MGGVPLLLSLAFVWLPALATVALSFFNWTGIGGFSDMKPAGVNNYRIIFSIYPEFPPAIEHNLLWLVVFFVIPAPFGLFLAHQLNKQLRGSRIYQSILFLPVVLSLALVGFMTELVFSPTQGLVNNLTGHARAEQPDRLAGRPEPQHLGRADHGLLAADRLRHDPVPGRAQSPSTRRSRRRRRWTARTSGRRSGTWSGPRCVRSTSSSSWSRSSSRCARSTSSTSSIRARTASNCCPR